MSKQYLTTASHDAVHPSPIFALTSTPNSVLSASGSSSLQIHSTSSSSFPHSQTLSNAHKVGCHHITTSHTGSRAVSVGFSGEVIVWSDPSASTASSSSQSPNDTTSATGSWEKQAQLTAGLMHPTKKKALKPGECWAVALSADGQYLAGTTIDGRVNIWDLTASEPSEWSLSRTYETKGSFGLCVDVSPDSSMTASGHHSGAVYVFNNETGRLMHSLPGLVRAVRTVKFSPGSTLLAAAGDARVIGVYDARHGEQVAALTGHQSWVMSLDWSAATGEYIVSGDYGGKVRVWRTETKECVSVMQMEEAEGAVWSVCWLRGGGTGAGTSRRMDGFVVGTERGGLRFLREAAGG